MDPGKSVWFASYGSNLSRERFLCYIQGGPTQNASQPCEGCRDRTPPRDDRAVTIHYPLYFAWESRIWQGGIAYLGHEQDKRHVTLGRMYLITIEQLEDVLAQKNAADNGPIEPDAKPARVPIPYLASKFACLLHLGLIDGIPAIACTSVEDMPAHPLNPPGAAYVRAMAQGLRECYGMAVEDIAAYLATKPGVLSRVDPDTLHSWIQ